MRELRRAVEELLEDQHIMSLAVDGPWVAALYYVYFDGSLWFCSKESARHITHQPVAAEIHAASKGWRDIRGVQLEGRISPARSMRAFAAYMQRFDFISEIKQQPIKTLDDLQAVFKVRFYKLAIEKIYYIDNSSGFGDRQEVIL